MGAENVQSPLDRANPDNGEGELTQEEMDAMLLASMTPREQQEELAWRQKARKSLERSKIIEEMPSLLGMSYEEAQSIVGERFQTSYAYGVDAVADLIPFLQKVKRETEAAASVEAKDEIRKKYSLGRAAYVSKADESAIRLLLPYGA